MRAVSESRFPVGSSAQTMAGLPASARAIVTRLLLAAGELVRSVALAMTESDSLEGLLGPPAGVRRGVPGEQQGQLDVLGSRKDRDQVEGLEDEAHALGTMPGAFGVGEAVDVEALDDHPSGVDAVEAGQTVEQGRLAGARWPHDRKKLARLNPEVEAFRAAMLPAPVR